jgi:hypothetical protein
MKDPSIIGNKLISIKLNLILLNTQWSEICPCTVASKTKQCLLAETEMLIHHALRQFNSYSSESGCVTVCFTLSNDTVTINKRRKYQLFGSLHNYDNFLYPVFNIKCSTSLIIKQGLSNIYYISCKAL